MRIVAALGGNALLRRGEAFDIDRQRANAAKAARALAPLAAEHELLVTHGNGPQIGFLARSAAAVDAGQEQLDTLGAQSEGLIGYLLEQALRSECPGRPIATLLTQTRVDSADPAFSQPNKPIGPWLSRAEADRLRGAFGWRFITEGDRRRRVVPSPRPLEILQLTAIRALLGAGILPICAGGGGVPVFFGKAGRLCGADAVVDKDLASSLLARAVGAEMLLLLTDVPAVYENWGSSDARALGRGTPSELADRVFEAGSMAPKVAAACEFASAGGSAAIGALEDAEMLARGECGTQVSEPRIGDEAPSL